MDRINKNQTAHPWFSQKPLFLAAFLVVILMILAYQSYDSGWLLPRSPLDLNGQPALLFFNRHKGCDSAVVVYRAAAGQLRTWSPALRQDVQLIQIDLDRRPDLGEQFKIQRAPTLLLLDAAGNTIYRQDEVVTDLQPINLAIFEQKIREMITGD